MGTVMGVNKKTGMEQLFDTAPCGKNINYSHWHDGVQFLNKIAQMHEQAGGYPPGPNLTKGFEDPKTFAKYVEFIAGMPGQGMSAVLESLMKRYHIKFGTQIRVDQSVTRDLALTDMDHIGVDDVPFK
mgnify:CR=1 FL=1